MRRKQQIHEQPCEAAFADALRRSSICWHGRATIASAVIMQHLLQVFLIGGSWSGGTSVKDAEIFDPADQTWTELPGIDPTLIYTDDAQGKYRADNHAWLFGWSNGLGAPHALAAGSSAGLCSTLFVIAHASERALTCLHLASVSSQTALRERAACLYTCVSPESNTMPDVQPRSVDAMHRQAPHCCRTV